MCTNHRFLIGNGQTFALSMVFIKCKWIKLFSFKTSRVQTEELSRTGRVCFCQLSTPSLLQQQQPCGKQVRSCQSNGRLQQEETGLNRCEQLPTAAQLYSALITHSLSDAAVSYYYTHHMQQTSDCSFLHPYTIFTTSYEAFIQELAQKLI